MPCMRITWVACLSGSFSVWWRIDPPYNVSCVRHGYRYILRMIHDTKYLVNVYTNYISFQVVLWFIMNYEPLRLGTEGCRRYWFVCLFCWLVGWLVGCLVDWLVGSFVGWLIDWLVGWLVRSAGCSCVWVCVCIMVVGSEADSQPSGILCTWPCPGTAVVLKSTSVDGNSINIPRNRAAKTGYKKRIHLCFGCVTLVDWCRRTRNEPCLGRVTAVYYSSIVWQHTVAVSDRFLPEASSSSSFILIHIRKYPTIFFRKSITLVVEIISCREMIWYIWYDMMPLRRACEPSNYM